MKIRFLAPLSLLNTLGASVPPCKSFAITEGRNLQFRAEAFNVLNKTNFQAAASNISTSTFGTITKTFPSRQIQLALKYTF